MPERRLTSLTNNKRKLLENVGATSLKQFKSDYGYSSDASAWKYILGKWNEQVDRLNEQERLDKESEKKRIADYHKEKRANSGSYVKNNFKLLPNNNKIDKVGAKGKKPRLSDLERYNTEKGVFAREVRVYYDCEQKADDWTNDEKKWKKPFRTYRAEVVIANTRSALDIKTQEKYDSLMKGLANISPEQNTNFEMKKGKVYNSNQKVPITKIKMKNSAPFKLNGEPLPSFEMGEGRCVYDALIHLWSQPNSKMLKKANTEYLNSIFITEDNPTPEVDGVDTNELLKLAKYEQFSMYAFDIHDKIITKYSSEESRQGKKPPLIYRLYNEHMYLICDKAVQSSLIAKNRNGENIRHKDIHNDNAKYIKPDETIYTNIIPDENEKTGNDFIYDYIMNSRDIPFPFTKKNINYDKGHINSMKIDDKRIFSKPIETDISEYLNKREEEYAGQHYVNILMTLWEEHYGKKLSENDLISHMNPKVCDLMNDENVKNRVHFGAMFELPDIQEKIKAGKIVGADIIKCYSSIIDNPSDNWLKYDITDEIKQYDGKLKTGLYFVKTNDLTILHKTNWYSNTIIEYAMNEGIQLEIIRQYVPAIQNKNKDYFKTFIDYISEHCGIKLTKNIINSLTGMFGKTRQSSYDISITTDINEVWNGLDDNVDRLDDFQLKTLGENDKMLYLYGFKNKRNIYTNNLPMYIQILDQSNIKLHQLSKQMGGEMLFRKTDAVIMYNGVNVKEFDKTQRKNWGKQTIMNKDELIKYDYCRMVNIDRSVKNPFQDNSSDFWNFNKNLNTSSQYKQIVEYAIEKGGLLICSRAGTGKSYVIKKAVEEGLIDDDKRCRLAFTNKARRNINGSTIHSAISINADNEKASEKMIQTYKGKKIIVVDEISMLSEKLWTQLVNIKRISGATFILLGDYRQLPAVEDKDHNYFDSSVVKFLTNNNQIELTERQRYDKELWDFLTNYYDEGIVGKNLIFTKSIDPDAYNICYLNKTRIEVNKHYMEYLKPDDALYLPHDKIDVNDRASSIYIYEGLPVMAIINKTKQNKNDETHQPLYCNSDTMKVIKYTDEIITMKLDIPDEEGNEILEVKISDFHKSFVCNYCSTTHKNQGATIEKNIQLWDWEKMIADRRIANTAISRARRIQQVRVVA
jgi:hypothetical protein